MSIAINPAEDNHINTVRNTQILVDVFGSASFDVTKIDPATVTLGGATPLESDVHFINKDAWPDETFVFQGPKVTLPAGWSVATVSGALTDGTTFSGSAGVDNKNASFYSSTALQNAEARQAARAARRSGFIVLPDATSSGTSVAISGVTAAAPLHIDMSTPSLIDPTVSGAS